MDEGYTGSFFGIADIDPQALLPSDDVGVAQGVAQGLRPEHLVTADEVAVLADLALAWETAQLRPLAGGPALCAAGPPPARGACGLRPPALPRLGLFGRARRGRSWSCRRR